MNSIIAELEIELTRRDAGIYAVALRYNRSDDAADLRLLPEGPPLIRLDFDALRARRLDIAGYGQLLGAQVLGEPLVARDVGEARANARGLEAPLRLRLALDHTAPELHGLYWEALRDPRDNTPLGMSEQVIFSRYLSSSDWNPILLRARGDLTAVALIANPSNLDKANVGGRRLAPVDVDGEQQRIGGALAGQVPTVYLASNGKATLQQVLNQLRDGCDILYLVAHGALVDGEPHVWLEKDDGTSDVVTGSDLVQQLRQLNQRPRLVVLASCQSAGTGDDRSADDDGALAALGPRLAMSGVPAVLAMQGNISMRTIAEFMPVFFTELLRDGQIDRAVAAARAAVRARPDAWMPVLFTRLKSGRIWYQASFGGDRGQAEERWDPLLTSIIDQECTPIIGPDLLEPLVGSRREIARKLAEAFRFPLERQAVDELPQVAQYLAVQKASGFLPRTLVQVLCTELHARHAANLPADLATIEFDKIPRKELLPLLDRLLLLAWERRCAGMRHEPYRVLAALDLPVYINADPSGLLLAALQAANKQPETMLCPWNDYTARADSVYQRDEDFEPTPRRPLVYQLYGRLNEPESLVLTEDDFFDYLIGVTANKALIPARVRAALSDSALLFLGFRADDWNFRVLFRTLLSQAGASRRDRYAHIAAQISLDEDRIVDPLRAQRFLETYFNKGAVSVFWGTPDEFVADLQRHRET